MITLLLTIAVFFAAMVMLGAGVLLGARHPLEGSCRTAGDPGAGSDGCDHCHCRR